MRQQDKLISEVRKSLRSIDECASYYVKESLPQEYNWIVSELRKIHRRINKIEEQTKTKEKAKSIYRKH